ncbi:hypothetical protein KDM41_15975 [bacterium]|nr:hypothetical protein [bacterium]
MVASLLVALVALAGCKDKVQYTERAGSSPADAPTSRYGTPPQQQAADGGAATSPAGGTTVAGITFNPPAGWQNLGADGMRQAQFRLAPVEGDTEAAEVNVFYFGAASGGGVEANLARWIGQMQLPNGGDPAAAASRSTFTADGMPGHVVSLDGTYMSGSMRPMGGGEKTPKEGFRLVGVVLEGPQGSVFFKLTGPAATAGAMEGELMTMVQAAHK